MKREAFEAYLIGTYGAKTRHVQDLVSRAQRVNDDMGDLDAAYVADGLRERLRSLSYSAEDQHNHISAPEGFSFNFDCEPNTDEWYMKLRDSLDSLREAVSLYAEFKNVSERPVDKEVYLAVRAREVDVELLKVDAPSVSVLRGQILNWFKSKGITGDGELEVTNDQLCAFIDGEYADGDDHCDEVWGERNAVLKVLCDGQRDTPYVARIIAVVRMSVCR